MDRLDTVREQWGRERPDLNTEPMELIGRFKVLSRFLSAEMERTFKEHGLNAASFDVLATLRRSGPPYALSPNDLLSATLVTSGTMTNRIDRLVAAGFVQRLPNPDDARGCLISLTPEGRSVIDTALDAHVKTQERLVSDLSKEEQARLNAILRRYMEVSGL
ncbi:MarR family transcriptional regulator [Kordiimonas sediminis]|uniref:MarR family transcriptional regulator n=1 Tax=Kordiimonas sediminis TaxID=1735581 RepID=A0A919ATB7_9PROT|nr:MarR family transcriptional regulator [Kordiimonas sediminis]GHF21224.1 MarR family transcriptional regulator [Kordiimonas sediminis]